MEITEVKVFPIQEEKLKAFVSIVFDQCFMVNDIKIIQGRDGLFISMPSRKKKNGEFKDVAHPLNNETRRMIEDRVLGEYERVLGERGERLPAPPHASHAATPPQLQVAQANPSIATAAAPGNYGDSSPAARDARLAARDSREPGQPLAAPPEDGAKAGPSGPADPSSPAGHPSSLEPAAEKSLEEIEEMHLRDSFWTVT